VKVYILCIGNGADAGDWPELGVWETYQNLGTLLEKAKNVHGLQTGFWVNIEGKGGAFISDCRDTEVDDVFNCLCRQGDTTFNPVARVHVQEVL
jgi:hypothetical protein